jgi:hypothetical protein
VQSLFEALLYGYAASIVECVKMESDFGNLEKENVPPQKDI